ncbi:hypothetical protein O9993_16580 [Vibrio lentus]|nr:hypothetical protein [Vibrio lentus]
MHLEVSTEIKTQDTATSSSDDLEQEAYGAELRCRLMIAGAKFLSRFSTNGEERDVDGNLEADTETIEIETQLKITQHQARCLQKWGSNRRISNQTMSSVAMQL